MEASPDSSHPQPNIGSDLVPIDTHSKPSEMEGVVTEMMLDANTTPCVSESKQCHTDMKSCEDEGSCDTESKHAVELNTSSCVTESAQQVSESKQCDTEQQTPDAQSCMDEQATVTDATLDCEHSDDSQVLEATIQNEKSISKNQKNGKIRKDGAIIRFSDSTKLKHTKLRISAAQHGKNYAPMLYSRRKMANNNNVTMSEDSRDLQEKLKLLTLDDNYIEMPHHHDGSIDDVPEITDTISTDKIPVLGIGERLRQLNLAKSSKDYPQALQLADSSPRTTASGLLNPRPEKNPDQNEESQSKLANGPNSSADKSIATKVPDLDSPHTTFSHESDEVFLAAGDDASSVDYSRNLRLTGGAVMANLLTTASRPQRHTQLQTEWQSGRYQDFQKRTQYERQTAGNFLVANISTPNRTAKQTFGKQMNRAPANGDELKSFVESDYERIEKIKQRHRSEKQHPSRRQSPFLKHVLAVKKTLSNFSKRISKKRLTRPRRHSMEECVCQVHQQMSGLNHTGNGHSQSLPRSYTNAMPARLFPNYGVSSLPRRHNKLPGYSTSTPKTSEGATATSPAVSSSIYQKPLVQYQDHQQNGHLYQKQTEQQLLYQQPQYNMMNQLQIREHVQQDMPYQTQQHQPHLQIGQQNQQCSMQQLLPPQLANSQQYPQNQKQQQNEQHFQPLQLVQHHFTRHDPSETRQNVLQHNMQHQYQTQKIAQKPNPRSIQEYYFQQQTVQHYQPLEKHADLQIVPPPIPVKQQYQQQKPSLKQQLLLKQRQDKNQVYAVPKQLVSSNSVPAAASGCCEMSPRRTPEGKDSSPTSSLDNVPLPPQPAVNQQPPSTAASMVEVAVTPKMPTPPPPLNGNIKHNQAMYTIIEENGHVYYASNC